MTRLWNVKVERMRTKIAGYNLLPVNLPSGIAGALGGIIDRSLIDPRSFIGAFPGILQIGLNSLVDIRKLHQVDRRQHPEMHIAYDNLNLDIVRETLKNATGIANSLGKMATFEAS